MGLEFTAYRRTRKWTACLLPFALLLLCATATASSDDRSEALVQPLVNAHFVTDGDPACLGNAVERGNPSTGPSTVLLRAERGCLIPWHQQTAAEQLIMIEGQLKVEVGSSLSPILGPGDFLWMPGKIRHQYTCMGPGACLLIVMLDRAVDIAPIKPAN